MTCAKDWQDSISLLTSRRGDPMEEVHLTKRSTQGTINGLDDGLPRVNVLDEILFLHFLSKQEITELLLCPLAVLWEQVSEGEGRTRGLEADLIVLIWLHQDRLFGGDIRGADNHSTPERNFIEDGLQPIGVENTQLLEGEGCGGEPSGEDMERKGNERRDSREVASMRGQVRDGVLVSNARMRREGKGRGGRHTRKP
jgi:hypothetical protein